MNQLLKFSFTAAYLSAFIGGAVAGAGDWVSPVYQDFYQYPLPIPPEAVPKTTYTNETTGIPIDFYELSIEEFTAQPYPGHNTTFYGYNGMFPGPTFRVPRGHQTLVRFVNNYTKDSSVHLHGSPTRSPWDGWAENVIRPGQFFDYYYPNNQAGRVMWYHDHAVHHTAENAYFGQAGFYILEDRPLDERLQLPTGAYDIPLMLTSTQFQPDYQLLSPVGHEHAIYGDIISVNGQPWPYLQVEPRKYRLRFLNAAMARTFLLSIHTTDNLAVPFEVIASDSGYLSSPQKDSNLYISMGERYEVIVDFTPYASRNLTVTNARNVMTDDDFHSTDQVMRFVVSAAATSQARNNAPPRTLAVPRFPQNKTTVDRTFLFEKSDGEWRINDIGFSQPSSRILARPPLGTTERWRLENTSGNGTHPVHIHLVDFKIVKREGDRSKIHGYEAAGVKDVVLLGKNEKVEVLAQYAPHAGLYMFHCHNGMHEDQDMMAAFNNTVLEGRGYGDAREIRLADPMDPRFRARDYAGTDIAAVVNATLPYYSGLDAYASVAEIEAAMERYGGE